ncbi:hypothetical protein DFJ58DRAFT_733024 [Suillus subalutaceus]|uniref:uncharacterized protein n=1 Tax=Suillus subalutaceus TaxID=48586 RepID=UPI001B8744A5|nr:uncharacterized protein DFJ58DRAFT_733024 [Suillus subalutaceus]KAG1840066.1 hypothetical protein DFJ58DRAFT_733024 [Suillus subalutaceus]
MHTTAELMQIYESDKHLSRYLHIIRDSVVYPIIYDAEDHVLSMPPIINSEHSKITLETKNVFIDTTATDDTKLQIVINMVAIPPTLSSNDPDALIVSLPCTRPDIFHEVDIMEDAAVAYGFNIPPDQHNRTTITDQRADEVIRREWAMAGWIEALPFILIRPFSPQRLYTSNPT